MKKRTAFIGFLLFNVFSISFIKSAIAETYFCSAELSSHGRPGEVETKTYKREGNFFVNKNIHTSDIKKMITIFLKKNHEISTYFFKGNPINWESVVANVFLRLLKETVPTKIPVFLIQEKIYFPTKFQQNILKTLDEVLEKELGSSKRVLKSYTCDSYNFENRPFFSNIFSRKIKFSTRYLNRISNQRVK